MAAKDALGRQFDKAKGVKTEPFVGLANNGQWTGGSAPSFPARFNYRPTGFRMMRPGDEKLISEQTAGMPWLGYN